MTNRQWINSLSDEQFAEEFVKRFFPCFDWCAYRQSIPQNCSCYRLSEKDGGISTHTCINGFLEWLKGEKK